MYKNKLYISLTLILLLLGGSAGFAQEKVQATTDKINLPLEKQRKLDYFFYEAMNAKSVGKLDSHFDFLQFCLDMDSTNANVLYEMGNYYNAIEDKESAFNFFKKAVKYDETNFYYRSSYAMACLESKENKEAIVQYEKLLKQSPDKSELYLYLSEAYRLDENIPSAIKALDRLEQSIGLNDKISVQKFKLYQQIKQEKKAFAEIQKHVDQNPNDIKYYLLLGSLYLQSNNTPKAYEVYTTARRIEPDNPYLISSMAEYYEYVDDKQSAEKELKTAIISPKMDVETKLGILAQYVNTLQQRQKDIEKANPLFDTLMIQHPQEPQLNLMYGNLLLLENKKEEAYEQFEIFAESNPTNPTGWEQMLATAFPDSIDRAADICTRAIEYLPEEAQFYFFLGVSNALRENYQEAMLVLKKGLPFAKKNIRLISDYYGQMGDVYYQLNKADSAFATYDLSLKFNPNNLSVLNNYSYYLSLAKRDIDKAEKMSGITIKAEPTNPTFLDTYGWILFEQGAYTMAKIYIEKSMNNSIEQGEEVSAEVLEHMGDALYMTGEKDEALEYWIKAQEKKKTNNKEDEILNKKIETKTFIEQTGTKK